MTQAATLAEISAIVLASGYWAGAGEPEFSTDGSEWSPVFIPTAQCRHPEFARASVHRVGAVAPVTVTVSWAESLPEDPAWQLAWFKRPMALFGARALRAAYRRAFGDVVEVAPNPAEGDDVPDAASVAEPAPDWSARIAAAASLEELEQLGKEMKKQRAFTTVLNREWKARKGELAELADKVKDIAERVAERDLADRMTALADRVAADEQARHSRPTPLVMAKKWGKQ